MTLDLHGRAVAAVEDCMQHFQIYFNASLLESLRATHVGQHPWIPADEYNLTTCVFNRGVLVLDTLEWRKRKFTEAIEWWMEEYAKSDRPLYRCVFKGVASDTFSDLWQANTLFH